MKMENFINLTPHSLTVEGLGTIPASGQVARVETHRSCGGSINGVRLVSQKFGEVQNLPEPREGVFYVVSALVLSALAGTRRDVVAPDTGPDAIREGGQIVAVRGFVQ